MSLEKEVNEIPSTEKSSNISNYFYGAVVVGVFALTGYLCYIIGQYVLEKAGPYLDTPPQIPFQ